MWLPWRDALKVAVVLAMFVAVAHRSRRRAMVLAVTTAREAALCFGLYTIWQFTRERAITKVAGAREHALWVWDLQQTLHVPSEVALQDALIDHRLVMQALNIYYGGVHVPAMGILLVWLFVRHRDRYPKVRTTLALLTAGCLTLQMIPVAPPRFFPELGFVDSGILYDQSVYGTGGSGISNQLAAMPSLHVGWSVLVALAAVWISRSRWRWLVVLHPLLTLLSVTATANHWWLDGVVAVMVLGVAITVRVGVELAVARLRPRVRRATADPPASEDEPPSDQGERGDHDPALVPATA